MDSSGFIKTAIGFVAGLIVALGCVLIYIKVSEEASNPPSPLHAATFSSPTQTVAYAEPRQDAAFATPSRTAPEPVALAETGNEADATPEAQPVIAKPERVPVVPKSHTQPVHVAQPLVEPLPAPADEPSSVELARTNPRLSDAASTARLTTAAPVRPTPERQPRTVTIQAGTALPIRLSQKLSSNQNLTGDTFRGTLEQPIILQDAIIADRGAPVTGRVINAARAGRAERAADLAITLTEINTTDGQHVMIATNPIDWKGPQGLGGDAAKIAGGTAFGALIGAMAGGGKGAAIGAGTGGAIGTGAVLVTRGRAAVFPVEARVEFHLAAPVTITEHLNF